MSRLTVLLIVLKKLFQIDYKIEDFQIGTEKMFMKQNIYNNLIKKKMMY